MEYGLGVQEGQLSALIPGGSEYLVIDHDDEHQDKLRQAGEEEKKGERIRIKAKQAGERQADPRTLKEEADIERPHRSQARTIQTPTNAQVN